MNDDVLDLLGETPGPRDWREGYRALVQSCGLTARSDRGAVRLAGARRAEMLNGLITNKVSDLQGAGLHAMLLNPKGRVLTDLRVLPSRDHLLLDVPRRGLANLLASFKKYLPPIYATFEDLSEELAQLGIYGPQAAAVAAQALGEAVPDEHLGVLDLTPAADPALVIRNRWLAGDGVEIIASRPVARALAEKLTPTVKAHDGELVGSQVLKIVRVECGLPEYGVDMTDENLAPETGLEEAISYDKGCYLGQEVVARIHFRGHVNRHLRSLEFEGGPAQSGARLLDGEKDVGVITSAVTSPEYGDIGLAYVRREIEPGSRLRWSTAEAEGVAAVKAAPFRPRPV